MIDLTGKLLDDISGVGGSRNTELTGHVSRFDGLVLECDGFPVSVGSVCDVETANGETVKAEVIGYSDGRNQLVLYEQGARIHAGVRVSLSDEGIEMDAGDAYLGRVVDALGVPLDGLPAPIGSHRLPLAGKMLNPLSRAGVKEVMDVGVRAVNGVLSIGRGQRIGIIAGSGVGKSVLLSMMARFTKADVIIVGLIGERAREVGDLVRGMMDEETRKRLCVIAVPADRSPLLRIRAAHRATALAEHFRDQGKNVLLIMDSLTRVAHARREIGLALGEQPTAKGYPASVMSLIPALVERAGMGDTTSGGSITGIYTVLADGDDTNDPVVDSARAILDGHVVLSRANSQLGIYPAVDIQASISRVMNDIVEAKHLTAARRLRQLISLYMENRDLMLMGGYAEGQDEDLDQAVKLWPKIVEFISQQPDTPADFNSSLRDLLAITGA
jgi:flagellum-specific ATP synthase